MQNLIPQDGIVYYYGTIMSSEDADHYYNCLIQQIDWQFDELIIFGKHITTKRKVAWYGDEPYLYTYSKKAKYANPWLPVLLELKEYVEAHSKAQFNSCLLNLYHNGSEGMSWHSDDEKELEPNGTIASLSFGAERKFSLKHKHTKQTVSQILEHGSLLIMKGETQTFWQHSLPKTKKVITPRINLTFRSII